MADHGQSFSVKNLQRMIQFAEVFADEKDCRITDTTIELDAFHRTDLIPLKNPFKLDFLNLKDSYSERDLETAILRDMGSFLRELGGGFSFIKLQKRMAIDGNYHYLDLLFYHRSSNGR